MSRSDFCNKYPQFKDVLELVNPPIEIKSLSEIEGLINDENRYTLIFEDFFLKIVEVVEDISFNKVEGDVAIVGVWKGGGALLLKYFIDFYKAKPKYYLFESFAGFNSSTLKHPKDLIMLKEFSKFNQRKAITKEAVLHLFKKMNMDDNLFIQDGYIEDTFTNTPIEKLSLIHIDVDFFEPTLNSLEFLYPKLEKGGWVLIDDYFVDVLNCKDAVDGFRIRNNIDSEIINFSQTAAGWKK